MAGRRVSRHEEFTRQIIEAHPFGEEGLQVAERDFGNADELFREVADIASVARAPRGQIIVE